MSEFTAGSVLGIVGAGAFGREVLPIAVAALRDHMGEKKPPIYFVESSPRFGELNGYPVISEDDFFALDCENRFFTITIADSRTRERLAESFIARGGTPFSLRSESALVLEDSEVGGGSVLCPFVSITSGSRIGKFFHANLYSYVAHDCVVGDYVTLAPRVSINGNVTIEDHVYIGTGAAIRQGVPGKPITIGRGAFIGMGAMVGESVPAGATVVGPMSRALPRTDTAIAEASQEQQAPPAADGTASPARLAVVRLFTELLEDEGIEDIPPLHDDLILLTTGLDSLGFAVLVTQLNDELGYDPFTMAEEAVYPRTLGEFVAIYEKYGSLA